MPYSYGLFKEDVKQHMIDNFPSDLKILDVGCGSGTYCDLLRSEFPFIDGIEIFSEYIRDFNLTMKYRKVMIGDIRQFDYSPYDYVIMGDILEHLSVDDAQRIVNGIHDSKICLLVAVPYLYEQGAEFNNVHETHLQPDLTHDLFLHRYPMMHRIFGDDRYGYYVNYEHD